MFVKAWYPVEHAGRQADDAPEVALQQQLAQRLIGLLALEDDAFRHDHAGAAVDLQVLGCSPRTALRCAWP